MNVDMADWENNVHIKFKSSPYGSYNHSHAEQNSFIIEAFGSPLAISSGYNTWYGSPHHSQWTWQSVSKNTILVNGHGQLPQSIHSKGAILATSLGAQFDYALGDATVSYMGELERFRRHLLFAKPNLIVIYDQLENYGKLSTYDWLLHSQGQMSVDEGRKRVRVEGETAHMWVYFITPEELTFHVTDEFPVPPEEPAAHKPKQWHLTATARSENGVERFLTVLVPRPHALSELEPPIVESVATRNGHGARLEADGRQYRVAFRDAEGEPLVVGGESTDAAVIVLWHEIAGKAHGFMAVDGTYQHGESGALWQASDLVSLGVTWWPDARLDVQLDGEAEWVTIYVPGDVKSVTLNGAPYSNWIVEGEMVQLHF